MAKCDLTIELDQPNAMHRGGGTITGVVRVDVDRDIHCNGLELTSGWRTHGRGNVASEKAAVITVFEGDWQAGQKPEYRFELPIAGWPPSYHGHLLNIDHYIDARARISWSFDPKASVPFLVRPTDPNAAVAAPSNVIELKGIWAGVAATGCGIFFVVFLFMVFSIGPFALVFLIAPLFGGAFWFFRFFLPKWLLGEIVCDLEQTEVAPGDQVSGKLSIRPRRNVSINGIELKLEAREQVVSGSGSNRTTHKHVLFDQSYSLQDASTLTAATQHEFPLLVNVPADAPYSISLSDNSLVWAANLRVDIPRWPDWVKSLPMKVLPTTQQLEAGFDESLQVSSSGPELAVAAEPAGISFAETVGHVWDVRDDRESLETLIDAVSGLTFDIEAIAERRLLYSGDDDPHVYKDGYAVWAHYPDPELQMVLYVPHDLADEFEQMGDAVFRGRGTIVGWDRLHERLQIKLESSI